MHALGFVHEQSRENRDERVKVRWEEIKPAYKNQFQKMPAAISMPVPLAFDFESVLLYPPTAFSESGRATIARYRTRKPLVPGR